MRTVAIMNQKGGCGKTTTSINLAACLARLGHKTLLTDIDPQGHCAVGLAVPEEQIERTVLDCLIEERDGRVARLPEVVWQIATNFDLAPSNIKLAGFEQTFAGRHGREDRLANALEPVKTTYEWCVIDCPPSVGLLTFNALRACDEVIVPVETGYFSLHGLTKMMETLELLRDRCNKDVLIRVLPTLYDTRTKLAREVLSELRAKFRDYLMESTVNFNTKLKEAASFGQPITEYDPGSRGYKDFVNLARELMGHRPVDIEPAPMEKLSRPAELVQRAKQLAQLSGFQFGRGAALGAGAAGDNHALQNPTAHGNGIAPETDPLRPERIEPEPNDPGQIEREPIEPLPVARTATAPIPPAHNSPRPSAPAVAVTTNAMSSGLTLGGTQPSGPASSTITAPAPAPKAATKPAALLNGNGPVAVFAPHQPVDELADLRLAELKTMAVPAATIAPAHRLEAALAELSSSAIAAGARAPRPQARKPDLSYGVHQINGEVVFAARFENASQVLVAGDFNGWSAMSTPLRQEQPGRWVTSLPLGSGRYRYRYIVDGQWVTDPHNQRVEANQFGELDNVVDVG